MKIVLDTNVLISAVFFGGVPGRILDAVISDRFELILSPAIQSEYHRVGGELAKGHPARAEALAPVLTMLARHATVVHAPPLSAPVCADASDDKFLAAAKAANASLVISGDRHLLDVSGWQGVTVLSPRTFLDRHVRGTGSD